MLIYRYWARLEGEAVLPSGKTVSFFAWGGSRSSQEDAETQARNRVQRIAGRVWAERGFPDKYAYGDRPLREEILQEYFDKVGSLVAAITRNSYGAAILNTTQVAFVDVDLPRRAGAAGLASRVSRWTRREPEPALSAEAAHALRRVEDWVGVRRAWGVRIYRTKSGLRYLITHRTFSPEDTELGSAMDAFGADPQYRRLCHAQKSFRARLTPKPWRVGVDSPPNQFPRTTSDQKTEMEDWLNKYNEASTRFASCQYVRSIGDAAVHPAVSPYIDLHDRVTRAESNLPLA